MNTARHFTLALLTLLAGCAREQPSEPLRSLRYQGMEIQTARAYADIDAFKNDTPNHLSENSLVSIEDALRAARFGPSFASQQEVADALASLRVPGYGSYFANQLGAKLDSQLELVYVELPQRQLNRYIALRLAEGGRLVVVADFVAAATPEIVRVRAESNGRLQFLSSDGAVVLSRDAA